MKTYSILILFLLSSCAVEPAGDYRLSIVNHTDYQLSYDYNVDTIPEYPCVNSTEVYFDRPVNINDMVKVLEYNYKPWPQFFERSKNKKLNLFIYNIDSLKAYKSIDTLIKRRIYKRLEYSEQELDKLDWTIIVKN